MRIKKLKDKKRDNNTYLRKYLLRIVYGCLVLTTALVLVAVDPITVATDWYLDMREESFLFNMWESPTYELFLDVWVYNYTNLQDYLRGDTGVLKLQEIGPFKFRELRTNENMTFVKERGVLSMKPKIKLHFLEEESVANLKDLKLIVPNIVVTALSTLFADQLGYIGNGIAYYSMLASGPTLFKELTVEQLLWGYHDPVVSIANKLLPSWIDFGKLGILDRFYAQRPDTLDVELDDMSKRYAIKSWNNSPGLKEQGFTDVNTSVPCNLVEGSYEGLMITPGYPKGQEIRLYRRQACRIYPLLYQREFLSEYGFNIRRYVMAESSFSKKSSYACPCTHDCLPEGFVDIRHCYYEFPIAMSKPHYLGVDPVQRSYFEGMTPDPVKYTSFLHVEPITGVPIAFKSNFQVNLAVRMSPANPITKPLKDKVLPLIWFSMYCTNPPPEVINLLRLRFIIAPPLIITLEIIFFIIGFIIGAHGFYRFWKFDYAFDDNLNTMDRKENFDKENNSGHREDLKSQIMVLSVKDRSGIIKSEELDKETVSLLSVNISDVALPNPLVNS